MTEYDISPAVRLHYSDTIGQAVQSGIEARNLYKIANDNIILFEDLKVFVSAAISRYMKEQMYVLEKGAK